MKKLSQTQEKDWNRAKLIADEANERDDVIEFRRDVLQGRILMPEAVGDWLEQTETAERGKIKSGRLPVPSRRLLKKLLKSPYSYRVKIKPRSFTTLAKDRPIRPIHGGVLERLLDLAEVLAPEYQWQERQAIDFLLTGRAQLVPSIGARIAPDGFYLWVRYSVSPAELREFYSHALKLCGIAKQRERATIANLNSKSEQQRRRRQKIKLLGPMMDFDLFASTKLRPKDTPGAKPTRQVVPTSTAVKRLGTSRATLYRRAKTGKIKRNKTASGTVRWILSDH